jgi:predicted O-methyltransferase YrrM
MGFNDQERRTEMMFEVVKAFEPEVVIETGTYQGATTEWFADNSKARIITIESSEWFFSYAEYRLSQIPQIEIIFGDSVSALQDLSIKTDLVAQKTLFYLDAHWNDYLPLADEINLIMARWMDFIIVIDDFEVDDDDGYTFDDYGPGKRLDKTLIPAKYRDQLFAYYPKAKSSDETSHKRGAIILIPKRYKDLLGGLSLLRPTPLPT